MTNEYQETKRMNRRTLLAAGGASSVAVLASAAGQAQAQQAQSDEGPPRAPTAQSKAITSMETWGGSLALQAATYAAPLVAMYNLRATVALGPKAKAPPGTIWKFEDIATPTLAAESGYVSPNVNVVYGFGFADLGQEPYVLTAPDSHGRYYMIEVVDMWTHAFRLPGGRSVRLHGRDVRVRRTRLEGHAADRRDPHRLSDALDRIPAACRREERSRPAGRAGGVARHQAAGTGGIHRRHGAEAAGLRLRDAEDESQGRQQHDAVRRPAAVLVDLRGGDEREPAATERDRDDPAAVQVSGDRVRQALDSEGREPGLSGADEEGFAGTRRGGDRVDGAGREVEGRLDHSACEHGQRRRRLHVALHRGDLRPDGEHPDPGDLLPGRAGRP